MELGSVILTPSTAGLGVAALGLVGLVVWWLMRKRQQRVWLPTVRIMRLESRILPRLVLRPPPLVSFLCFLVAALVLVGFALRPRTQVFTPFEPNQTKILIFCDMSPSVSAHISIDDYAAKMAALYESLKGSGRISIATSHSPDPVEPQSGADVAQLIKRLGFHRAGLRLGAAMKVLLESAAEIDRLFIVSDRDQHSWTGFNWRYLLDEMDVIFYDLGGSGGELQNVFINDARFLSTPASPTMDWDVEVARRLTSGDLEGKVDVTYMGKTLGTFPWKLTGGKQRQSVRASWPASAVLDVEKEGGEGGGLGPQREVPLVFHVEVEGGRAADALSLDDDFRTAVLGLKQDALVVSESAGERLLEDPAEQLEVALQIQGFRLRRYDTVAQPGPKPEEFPFIILLGGAEGGVDRFCPRSLEAARLAAREKAGEHGARRGGQALPKVWLAPQTLDANWRDLCRCYSRLLLSANRDSGEPAFCQHVESRREWLSLLPSVGAKQIGGVLGDASKALAWHGRDQASGLEVLAFTVPLTPLPETGLSHAEMPILVKELLTWQGLLEAHGGSASWPRVEDLVARTWRPAKPLEPSELAQIRLSNVPLGESMLGEVDEQQLPPRWTAPADVSAKVLPAKKDREDPLPWLKLAAIIVVAVTGFEGLWTLGGRLLRFLARRPEAAGGAALALLLLGRPGRAEARVELDLIGYQGDISLQTLSREVAHRTSIEMEPKPNTFSRPTQEALGEPWLWVKDIQTVTQANGTLKPDMVLWLKRGGFLVLEQALAPPTLAKLTSDMHGLQASDGVWQPLPPDHELMRSFYLIDALPGCNGEIWRGFEYDGRLAILALPYGFLQSLKDRPAPSTCANAPDQERATRVFVNLIMVALATDYKKDQIHLPEILKRLR